MPNSPVLSIRKLRTSEDEGLQQELTKIARTDPFARDIVIAGAILEDAEDWARIDEAISELSGQKAPTPNDYTREEWTDYTREEWAYYLGISVGVRLAGGAR